MLRRNRFNRFKKAPKSPYDESGPNATSLRRGLEWLERHGRDLPSNPLSEELRKTSAQLLIEPPEDSAKPATTNQSNETPPEKETSQTEAPPETKPETETGRVAREHAEEQKENVDAKPAGEEPPQTEPLLVPSVPPVNSHPQTEPSQSQPVTTEPPPEHPSAQLVQSKAVLADLVDVDETQIEADEIQKLARPSRSDTHLDPRRFVRPHSVHGPVDLPKHVRCCCICQHPQREAIEEGFLEWRRAAELRHEFELPNRSCIYRHAHAFGLFDRRAQLLRFGLENIIEESSHCLVTAESVIRAIRAHSCLDENGRWIEPPRRVIISRESLPEPQPRTPKSTSRRTKAITRSRRK